MSAAPNGGAALAWSLAVVAWWRRRDDYLMAGVDSYRKIVKRLLLDYAQHSPSQGEIEMATVFDEGQGRYQLMALGWRGKQRIHGCVIHIDLKGNKVWLQHDSTDAEIAKALVEMGVPADHIVLGFLPEGYRKHTDFAVS